MVLCEKCQCVVGLSEDEIRNLIDRYVNFFGLRTSDLFRRKTIRPMGNINGVSLSEIRRAVCLLLSEKTKRTKKEIGSFVGISDHSSVCTAINSAKNFRLSKDETFMYYYGILQKMSIISLSNNFVNVE